MRWFQSLAAVVAPPVCILCGGAGQSIDEPWGLDLCIHCELACPRAAPEPAPFATAFCLFRYEDPVDQMIVRLKFQHELAQARVLGTLFARAYRESGRALPECVVPMPLHRSRFVERGFCQTTALARHICHRLRTPLPRRACGLPRWRMAPLPLRPELLCRTRATRAQSGLDAAARARNLQGAFLCPVGEHAPAAIGDGAPRRHPSRPLPRHIALLDDVLTTGHTALAAIGALQAAGIEQVELWTIARAGLREVPGLPQGGPAGPIC